MKQISEDDLFGSTEPVQSGEVSKVDEAEPRRATDEKLSALELLQAWGLDKTSNIESKHSVFQLPIRFLVAVIGKMGFAIFFWVLTPGASQEIQLNLVENWDIQIGLAPIFAIGVILGLAMAATSIRDLMRLKEHSQILGLAANGIKKLRSRNGEESEGAYRLIFSISSCLNMDRDQDVLDENFIFIDRLHAFVPSAARLTNKLDGTAQEEL